MTRIEIGEGVALDTAAYERSGLRVGIFGSSGAGKGWLLGAMLEDLIAAGLPVVMLDPEAELWTFQEVGALVVGGPHGDAPFVEDARAIGAAVDYALTTATPVVFDLSEAADSGREDEVARAGELVARTFWTALNRQRRRAVFAATEAALFAPQQIPRGTTRPEMLRAFMQRGRKRGLTPIVETQRSADIQKMVISQANVRFIGRLDSTEDYDAVKRHLAGHTFEEMRGLPAGTFYLSPLGEFVQVRDRRVTHGGGTPAEGEEITIRERGRRAAGLGDVLKALHDAQRSDAPEPARATAPAPADDRALREVHRAYEQARDAASSAAQRATEMEARALNAEAEARRLTAQVEAAARFRDALLGFVGEGMPEIAGRIAEGAPADLAPVEREVARLAERLARVESNGGSAGPRLAPVAKLRADFLEAAAQRLVEIMAALDGDERQALLFLLTQDRYVTINAVAKAITGSDSGSMHKRWSTALRGLIGKGLAVEGGSGGTGRRAAVEAWIRSALGPHAPTDGEVEAVRDRALAVLAE